MATLSSYALTTLADVKESLSISSGDTSKDNLIIRKINQATDVIENYCGRRFALTSYTNIVYSATQIDQLVLRQRPVVTLSALEIRNTGLNQDNWETIDTNLYFLDESSGVINLMFNAIGRWDRYRVSYIAGYTDIPSDLAEACASLAAFYVLNADSSDIGKARIREGNRDVMYAKQQVNFETIIEQLGIDSIINTYRNYNITTDR